MYKWILAAIGFFIYRFPGLIIGMFVGSMIDNGGIKRVNSKVIKEFELNLLSLASILIKSDGKVSESELQFVRNYFISLHGHERAKRLFKQFNTEVNKKRISVEKICNFYKFRTTYETRLQIINLLFNIAKSDGSISNLEIKKLGEFSRLMNISNRDFESIKAMFIKSSESHYKILEIEKNCSNEDLKKAYRDLAKSLINDKQYRNAWYNYLEYLRIKDNNISDLELNIIINDMERLYHVYGLKKKINNFSTSKIFSDIKNDIRIVFEWTIPNEKIKIEIINPKKQSVEFTLGSNSNNFEQIDEFFLNGDILGNWIFNAKTMEGSNLNGTLKVTVYKNWLSNSKNKPIKKLFFFRQIKEGYYRLFKMNV